MTSRLPAHLLKDRRNMPARASAPGEPATSAALLGLDVTENSESTIL